MAKRDGDDTNHDVWRWTADGAMRDLGCLIFSRGATPEQMIAAYGLDPGTARLVPPAELSEAVPYPVAYGSSEVIRAGRIGEWAFVIDESLLANTLTVHAHDVAGHLPEGTEGAQVLWTGPEGRLSYWTGDGDRCRFDPELDELEEFLRRAGADPGLAGRVDFEDFETPVQIRLLELLTLAERAFGLSLDEARLRGNEWISAPPLPLLRGLKAPPSPEWPDRAFIPEDQVISLLLRKATDAEVRAMLGPRLRFLLAETGLADDEDLVDATEAALNGQPPPVGDDTPAGRAVRRLELDSYNTHHDNYRPRTAEERQRRGKRRDSMFVLDPLLAGRYRLALSQLLRRSREPTWREEALEALADVRARVTDDELAQAEAAQRQGERWRQHPPRG